MTPRERYRRQEARDRATAQRLAGRALKPFEDEMIRARTTMAVEVIVVVAVYMEMAIAIGRASEAAKRLRLKRKRSVATPSRAMARSVGGQGWIAVPGRSK